MSEDLYLVLGSYNISTQEATYKIVINPLVNWIWFGFAVMAIGTGLALLPESAFAFAVAKVPAGAATTSLLLLFVLLPWPVRAQHVENPQAVIVVPKSQLEKDMLARARSRDVLLPILLYPITIPVIIAGVRGTAVLLQPEANLPVARMVVPELRASSGSADCWRPPSPRPWISSDAGPVLRICTPSRRKQSSVAAQSAPGEKPVIDD